MAEKTILLVDTDTPSLNFLSRLMREHGYAVIQTTIGKEGLIFLWRDRPDLVIFDPGLQDISGEQFLSKIRQDSRSSSIPVFALSADINPERKAALLQAGCNEYLVKSGDAVSAIPQTVSKLLAGKKVQTKAKRKKDGGNLVVFLSGKGGTGVSSLCANYSVAICESKPEARVAVADLVLPIGSIANITGYKGELDIVKVSKLPKEEYGSDYFQSQLPTLPGWRFHLLPGSTSPQSANDIQVDQIPDIIEALITAYDYVIVDLGRSLSRISMPIIQQADLLALILSTDQSTATLTKAVWDYLKSQGIEEKRIFPILNRVIGLEGLTKGDAEKIIGLGIKTTIPYMGGNFVVANNQNQPISVKYPGDTITMVVKESAAGMISLINQLQYETTRES